MRVQKAVKTKKDRLLVRKGPGKQYKDIDALNPGQKVVVVEEKNGWSKLESGGWAYSSYLKTVADLEPKKKTTPASNPKPGDLKQNVPSSNIKEEAKSTGLSKEFIDHSQNSISFKRVKALDRSMRIFGVPHQFTPDVDFRVSDVNKLGRKFGETMMAEAPIVSFMPCAPNYLPDANKEMRKNLTEWFSASEGGMDDRYGKEGLKAIMDGKSELRYYSTTPVYPGYIRIVNLLCRSLATYMGLGNYKGPNGKTKLRFYDWGTYKWANSENDAAKTRKESKTIFEKGADFGEDIARAMTYRDAVVRFYVDTGTSFSESLSNSTTASKLEGFADTLEGFSKELAYFIGSSNEASMAEVKDKAAAILAKGSNLATPDGVFDRVLKGGSHIVNGANMIFPEMWSDSSPSRNFSISMTFTSPYGHPLAIYYNCLVPLMHLLAMTAPIQVSPNSYRAPYLVRVNSKGWFSCEMGIIESLSIDKGTDNQWTINGFPSVIKVNMSITDLYNNFMVTSTHSPSAFFRNDGLINYLAVNGNIDMDVPQPKIMAQVAWNLLRTGVTDIPADFGRQFINGLREAYNHLFSL